MSLLRILRLLFWGREKGTLSETVVTFTTGRGNGWSNRRLACRGWGNRPVCRGRGNRRPVCRGRGNRRPVLRERGNRRPGNRRPVHRGQGNRRPVRRGRGNSCSDISWAIHHPEVVDGDNTPSAMAVLSQVPIYLVAWSHNPKCVSLREGQVVSVLRLA